MDACIADLPVLVMYASPDENGGHSILDRRRTPCSLASKAMTAPVLLGRCGDASNDTTRYAVSALHLLCSNSATSSGMTPAWPIEHRKVGFIYTQQHLNCVIAVGESINHLSL